MQKHIAVQPCVVIMQESWCCSHNARLEEIEDEGNGFEKGFLENETVHLSIFMLRRFES